MTAPKTGDSDRLAILARGRRGRAVKRPDAHLDVPDTLDLDTVPTPYEARGADTLDENEQTDLATCERAVAGLQRALAVAGKALATINAARLYRGTHGTFEAYVEERWGMKRAHAYRLIDAWPVAAALSPIGDTNEAQVRELLPAAKRHGTEAAVAVYTELHEHGGGQVTAARIRQAVRALPPRIANPDQARDALRAALAEGRLTPPAPRADTGPGGGAADTTGTRDGSGSGSDALSALAALVEQQRRLYDELGGGLIPDALHTDPGRAEALLRDLARHANRTAYRARTPHPNTNN